LRPLELKYFKMYDDIKTARQIEYRLKRLKSRCIIERIIAEREIKLVI
jgi:predicted GIY-YIG superfamily endonuclease